MTKFDGPHVELKSASDWLVIFRLLGFFWGSSYLFIKIGVDAGLTPFTLVMLRLFFGSAAPVVGGAHRARAAAA